MSLPVDYIATLGLGDDQRKLHSRLRQAVIMLVDDDPEIINTLEAFLKAEGYHLFLKVDQSSQVIESIKSKAPDILLLSSESEGLNILENIRQDNDIKMLPVIVITPAINSADTTDSDNKLKALMLGATEFLTKPINACDLSLRLRSILTSKAYQDQLAYYDTLTRLPNRKLFIECVDRALNQRRKAKDMLSVMSVAVDRFKQINDSFGFAVGDTLLQRIATRLMNVLRNNDRLADYNGSFVMGNIARSGGDEFSVLLANNVDVNFVNAIAERFLSVLREPFDIDGNEIFITASIGVASYPGDGIETDTLLREADTACAFAKRSGRDTVQLYSPAINAMSRERMSLENGLRRAIEKEQLSVYYQPKISISSGQIMGMEAILRWCKEDGTWVSPDEFIPIAEDTGLIVPLGEWILNEACRQNSVWQRQGLGDLKVSVNVSGHQFRKIGFVAFIENTLASTGLDPRLLIVELTESMLTGNIDRHIRILEAIKAMGASLSIDDFGTGYSSLSYLSRFPIAELKIDRSFIVDVPNNRHDTAIVNAIVAMAQSLNLSVVAEGVENVGQVKFLSDLGCDIIQGYYFSKPLSAEEFTLFIQSNKN